ncbi:MAG: VWA domain-containing protein [Spirochaetes bacterium]|nr:VWA domain-containing protein [Spirochaetota bacterium]
MIKYIFNKIIFLIIISGFSSASLFADYVRISQIDSSRLLLSQEVKVYVSVTNVEGEPVGKLMQDAFTLYESPDSRNFTKIPDITGFQSMANYESGINFLLLIDNSGSMYRNMKGARTKNESDKRISHAKKALITFLKSISNPKDTVGLAVYNSYYTLFSGLTGDKAKIEDYLDKIMQPNPDEAFTEIYSSIYTAVDEFSSVKGRKAIIVLSDGRNQPYYKYTRKAHKTLGTKIFEYAEPAKYCQEEGVSVYAINFGPKSERKDQGLSKIALQTGGSVFDAFDPRQLNDVYNKIVNQILGEYLISYPATMEPADKKYVKVECNTATGLASAVRFYFSSTVFGLPLTKFNFLLVIPFLLAVALLWLLSNIKFEKKRSDPSIEVLNPGSAKASTNFFTLDKNKKTIIGGDPSADMTLSGGATKIKEKHATVAFDKVKKQYTIVADGNLTVNNKPVKTKLLEPGDVINVGGTTIVFDDGEVDK